MAASVGPGGANLARKASLAKESGHKIGGSSWVVTCDWIRFADTLFVSVSDIFLYGRFVEFIDFYRMLLRRFLSRLVNLMLVFNVIAET